MSARTNTSAQITDLLRRPISVSYGIVGALENASQPPKTIATRVLAAKAILKAAEGSGTHLEQILDRTEGKVGGNEQGGSTINFNFVVQGAHQVGEVIEGVLNAAANTNGELGAPLLAQDDQLGAINPPIASTPGDNPPLALPAPDLEDEDDGYASGAD